MEGPLVISMPLSSGAEMVFAILIGIGFGLALERAGFGRADNLTSIFYGRDFRVMRVMFTAIVTAMVGLYFLDLVGILPLGTIGIRASYVGGQLAGGLILGAGFVIGGYCPGTSIVGALSGKIDAVFFIGGAIGGSALYTLSADAWTGLQNSGSLGKVLLGEYFGIPSGIMVMIIAVVAIGMLYAAGRIESLVNARLTARKEQS